MEIKINSGIPNFKDNLRAEDGNCDDLEVWVLASNDLILHFLFS